MPDAGCQSSLTALRPVAKAEVLAEELVKGEFLTLAQQGAKAAVAVGMVSTCRGFIRPMAALVSSFIPSPSEVRPALSALSSTRKRQPAASDAKIQQLLQRKQPRTNWML
jgi:hypothetical protein